MKTSVRVISDRKIGVRMKGTVCKMVVRPPMMDGVLIWRQKQETKLEVAELTISRFTVE